MELNGGVRPDLRSWIGDLMVDPKYQKKGLRKILVDATITKTKELGFEKLCYTARGIYH